MLDDRKTKLLKAIIDDYIQTAVPVASRALSKKHDFGLSSATIRNEMSDLEELGFLEQPHTSAGRVPTLRAYRLYVDTMMRKPRLTQREVALMRSYFSGRMLDMQSVVAKTAKVLAELTDYPAVVVGTQLSDVKIRHIQLVPVSPGSALLIVVTDAGMLQDTVIKVPEDIGYKELDMLSNMLNARFRDQTLRQVVPHVVDELNGDFQQHKEVFEAVMHSVSESLGAQQPPELALGGARNILNHPEYKDLNRARSLLAVLETRDVMLDLLMHTGQLELSITIGQETSEDNPVKDCSIVTATYRIGNQARGSMGIIGPTRMNYAKVAAVVDGMGKMLGAMLNDYDQKD